MYLFMGRVKSNPSKEHLFLQVFHALISALLMDKKVNHLYNKCFRQVLMPD